MEKSSREFSRNEQMVPEAEEEVEQAEFLRELVSLNAADYVEPLMNENRPVHLDYRPQIQCCYWLGGTFITPPPHPPSLTRSGSKVDSSQRSRFLLKPPPLTSSFHNKSTETLKHGCEQT